ncbi:MAG TPA: virulence factor [Roseiflexaceae bacterium]
MRYSALKTQNSKLPCVAFVACGALAREVLAIAGRHGWNIKLFGVAAADHMVPARIAPDVERRLRELIPRFERVVVVYGDCGTAGRLDELLERYNVPRIAGPHCYEMYGGARFDAAMAQDPGAFFLTDFLVRGFEGTVWKGLGLDRFPELKNVYFANYSRLIYLAQQADTALIAKAESIAALLGLPLDVQHTGYGLLEQRLVELMGAIHENRYAPVLPGDVRTLERWNVGTLERSNGEGRMATYQVLYWHDIPVQVRARAAGGRASAALPERFQEAIDQAAMVAGLIGSDDYTAAFRWGDAQERDGSAREVADAVAAEIAAQHPTIDWRATVAAIRP